MSGASVQSSTFVESDVSAIYLFVFYRTFLFHRAIDFLISACLFCFSSHDTHSVHLSLLYFLLSRRGTLPQITVATSSYLPVLTFDLCPLDKDFSRLSILKGGFIAMLCVFFPIQVDSINSLLKGPVMSKACEETKHFHPDHTQPGTAQCRANTGVCAMFGNVFRVCVFVVRHYHFLNSSKTTRLFSVEFYGLCACLGLFVWV